MNISCGNAVSPISYRSRYKIAVRKFFVSSILLACFALAAKATIAAAFNSSQSIRLDGMVLYYGIVPAEILRDHPLGHEERTMHADASQDKATHHLVISIFDEKTRKRVTDAVVTASVGELGMSVQNRKLEMMSLGSAVTYGNFFEMPKPGRYEIVVNVRRLSDIKAATVRFEYRNPG